MKFAFFGASVTAQKEGYWYHLSRKMKTQPYQKGYGGQHLCDAGICRINEVTKLKPDLCIIDWFSTGFGEISERTKTYIDTIIHAFSVVNCRLIFIILPKEEHDSRKDFYDFVKKHLSTRGVFYIDINDYVLFSDKICRDSVHTTPHGSILYSNLIFREYKKNKDRISVIKDTEETIYTNINSLKFNHKINKFLTLNGKGKIVTFALTMGKGNGFVEIDGRKIQTWDRWCHYERLNCKINDIDIDGEVTMNILGDHFDYSSCAEKSINFNKIKKYLIIQEIFYTGELKIVRYA